MCAYDVYTIRENHVVSTLCSRQFSTKDLLQHSVVYPLCRISTIPNEQQNKKKEMLEKCWHFHKYFVYFFILTMCVHWRQGFEWHMELWMWRWAFRFIDYPKMGWRKTTDGMEKKSVWNTKSRFIAVLCACHGTHALCECVVAQTTNYFCRHTHSPCALRGMSMNQCAVARRVCVCVWGDIHESFSWCGEVLHFGGAMLHVLLLARGARKCRNVESAYRETYRHTTRTAAIDYGGSTNIIMLDFPPRR